MTAANPDAAMSALLEGRPTFRLILRDRDYGMPCPRDRWEVKEAIDGLLKPAGMGTVLDLDVLELENGECDDVLVIGTVNPATALPQLCELLKQMNVPQGAVLTVEGSEENLLTSLVPRDTLVRDSTDNLIQLVLAESIRCAPADWQAGTLTIECDGNWLGYKLKNPESENAATISDELRQLCEEFAVLMWKNGNRWTEAVLRYEGQKFNVEFSYDERAPETELVPPALPKAWWKLW